MLTDAVLVDRVVSGFDDAFDELYRRHAQAAWRVGQSVAGNAHDAADAVSEAFARVLKAVRDGRLHDGTAFRSYLLTATRNAALDGLRRSGRTRPTDTVDIDLVAAETADAPALGAADAVLLAEAFRNLPERWRSVLWLTEVEGIATKDAADQLGLSANGTAQLAVRARAGLRDRYLQAHVRNHARPECRFTVEHLGAYVGGGISPRDLAKVDQHLAGCADCRARKEELEDLGSSLRRIVLPIPLALGALSARKVHAVLTASSAAPGSFGSKALQLAKEPTPFMKKAVGASAAGVLALGILAIPFAGNGSDRVEGLAAPKAQANASAPAVAEAPAATYDAAPSYTSSLGRTGTFEYTAPSRSGFTAPSSSPKATTAPKKAEPKKAAPPAATRPEQQAPTVPLPIPPLPVPELPVPLPDVNVGVNLLDQKIGLAVDLTGEAGVGVSLPGDVSVGNTTPTAPAEQGASISVGETTINLP